MHKEIIDQLKRLYICNNFLLDQYQAMVMKRGATENEFDWMQSCHHEQESLLKTITYFDEEFLNEPKGIGRLNRFQGDIQGA